MSKKKISEEKIGTLVQGLMDSGEIILREGTIRIIAGEWRSRRLPVVDVPGLRPSGDRARETLFNWLHPYIPGAVCVDLFAGTGALGFEAASRGAAAVTLVDKHAFVIDHLQENIEALEASQVSVHHGDAMRFLQDQPRNHFDIIFVDPPFQERMDEADIEVVAKDIFGAGREGGTSRVANGPLA